MYWPSNDTAGEGGCRPAHRVGAGPPRALTVGAPDARPLSAMAELDRGAVEAIFNGDTSCAPRVQLLDVKLIPPKPGAPAGSGRYRLVISDGLHLMQATKHPCPP